MKVSVVIPAYNEESVIAGAINTLLLQTYSDYEIIVVDNASTDRTSEIASSVAATSSRIRVVKQPIKGLLHARECGRKNAIGEIIANMDADCAPDSDWIAKGVALFASSDISVISGPYFYYDASFSFRYTSLFLQKILYGSFGSLLQLFGKGAVMIGGNNFIRASSLEKVGGYTTSIAFWGEDTDTAKKLAKTGKIFFSNNLIMKTSARRFHDQGMIKTFGMYMFYFFKHTFTNKRSTL